MTKTEVSSLVEVSSDTTLPQEYFSAPFSSYILLKTVHFSGSAVIFCQDTI
jgi:hypothetical protein